MNKETTELIKELKSSLATSNGIQRKAWTNAIIKNDLKIKDLSELLWCEQKIANRFLWLLSDIGLSAPNKLLKELTFLLNFFEQNKGNYITSMASFWRYVGVPIEDEGRAIDLLFSWLVSKDTNVTTKSRSLFVLFELTKKYPDLKNELKLCLQDQMNKQTPDFEKRAKKILMQLEQ